MAFFSSIFRILGTQRTIATCGTSWKVIGLGISFAEWTNSGVHKYFKNKWGFQLKFVVLRMVPEGTLSLWSTYFVVDPSYQIEGNSDWDIEIFEYIRAIIENLQKISNIWKLPPPVSYPRTDVSRFC